LNEDARAAGETASSTSQQLRCEIGGLLESSSLGFTCRATRRVRRDDERREPHGTDDRRRAQEDTTGHSSSREQAPASAVAERLSIGHRE
jgi:hypothetical protein